MNIFDHLIPDSAILGIGPIFLEFRPNDPFNARRYFFDLHLTAHTTRIQSDWFYISNGGEEVKEQMKSWKSKYFFHREKIASLVGADADEYEKHRETVAKIHDDIITTLETVFADLQPKEASELLTESINLRKQRVMDLLLDLKVIASK